MDRQGWRCRCRRGRAYSVRMGGLVMGYATDGARSTGRSDLGRLWWAGPLTALAALAANFAVRAVAFAVFPISPEFHNLMWGHLLWVTIAAVAAAVLVFAVV